MATFDYNGTRYEFDPIDVYHKNLIVLPDGTVLQPKGWLESSPPQLTGVEAIPAAKATVGSAAPDEAQPASLLDEALASVVKEIRRHEATRVERAINELCALAEEAGKPFHDAPKIRSATIAEGRHVGLVEAIATLRKHFPKVAP